MNKYSKYNEIISYLEITIKEHENHILEATRNFIKNEYDSSLSLLRISVEKLEMLEKMKYEIENLIYDL